MRTRTFTAAMLLASCLLAAAWLNQGCYPQLPPMGAIAPTATPSLADWVVSTFENRKVQVNATLRGVLNPTWNAATPSAGQVDVDGNTESGLGSWSASTYGGAPANTLNGGLSPSVCNDPGNPCFILPIPAPLMAPGLGNYAAHLYGTLSMLDGKYESHQLVCRLRLSATNPYYDASSFSGIRFDFYRGTADTNLEPKFQMAIDYSLPPGGGTGGVCTGVDGLGTQCYNHFQYLLNGLPQGSWQAVTIAWIDLTKPVFGQNLGPNMALAMVPGEVGTPPNRHQKKIIFLQWQFSDNLPAGSTKYTDFWVDNVEFVP